MQLFLDSVEGGLWLNKNSNRRNTDVFRIIKKKEELHVKVFVYIHVIEYNTKVRKIFTIQSYAPTNATGAGVKIQIYTTTTDFKTKSIVIVTLMHRGRRGLWQKKT